MSTIKRLTLVVLLVLFFAAPLWAQAPDAIAAGDVALDCNSPTIVDRPIGAAITRVDLTEHGILVDFTRKDGSSRWPDVVPPGWDGPIQYTVWIGMRVGGAWHLGAVLEFWYGRGLDRDVDAGNNPIVDFQVARNWTYFCGALARQPNAGEQVAVMVSAGDQRRPFDVSAVRERSNIVLVSWPSAVPTTFTFSATPTPTPIPTPIQTPQPTPTPTPVPIPTPIPTPPPAASCDLTPVLTQLAACNAGIATVNQNVDTARAEQKAWQAEVKSVWAQIGAPLLKFVAPAVLAFFGGKAVAK